MRIFWQSFVDPNTSHAYIDRLSKYLNSIASPGTEVEVFGMTPTARSWGRLSELRGGVMAVENAIRADKDGFDAFVYGHFQEPALYEARSACEIPVCGIGESSLLWASHLGRRIGLISIDAAFETIHLEQLDRYGMGHRVVGVRALGATLQDFESAFAGNLKVRSNLFDGFQIEARILLDRGADVIIPAGGLFGLLASSERGLSVDHAPVVNCLAIALYWAEMSVRLRRETGVAPSRGSNFARASHEAITDFQALRGATNNAEIPRN